MNLAPRHPTRPAAAGRSLAGALAILLLAAVPALAQHGQIRGTVTDAATGETLPGVNVFLEGTTLGAATDANGNYVIIGVRPGTYTLVFSFIGYQTVRVEDIRVRIDLSTTVDMQLREAVFEGEEIVVTAVRELVQRDLTATTAIISADEIRALPVENFGDIINLQAGVVNGHFRGGRRGEVGFWVDGLPVQDVYDGGLALHIENAMIQEAQIVTGAFNAEFGQAMSGIVNVVTRDGTNTFEGHFHGFTGDYLPRNALNGIPYIGFQNNTRGDTLATGLAPFQELHGYAPFSVQNAELTLAGPVIRDRLFFFTSGRHFRNDGWIIGRDYFTYESVWTDETGRIARRDALPDGTPVLGDSSAVAMNPYERLSGLVKLTAHLGHGMRLAANVMGSREDYKDFDLGRFFFPRSQMHNRRDAISTYLKLTHALSSRTFYEAGITNNFTAFETYLFPDPQDPRYRDAQYFQFSDPLRTSNFRVGGTDNRRFFRSTNTWLFKADLSSQINHENLIKVGVEGRHHTLTFRDVEVLPWQSGDPQNPHALASHGSYTYHPIELSAYAQNKIELGDLIINVGVRLDYFDAAAPVFRDPTDPDAVFPERRRCVGFDENNHCLRDEAGNPIWHENIHTPEAHFRPASPKWQLSPRLGVAFPITAGGVVHFSYGHFFQRPAFERLYQNPYFRLGAGGSGLVGLVGNADMRPEQTISGEIGLKQQLTERSAFEITVYYRDIRNLAGTALEPIRIRGTGARYGQLGNSDFGFVRGLILRYDQRFARDFHAGFDYTFQVARANASDPNQSFGAAAALGLLERRILPTDWDQRHTIAVSLAYTHPTLDAGVGMIATYGSGTPYTPLASGTGQIAPGRILLNAETKPSVFNVNLSAHKNFQVFGAHEVQVFSQIDNLLDRRNEVEVFGETGTATYSLNHHLDGRSFVGERGFLDQWYTRPNYFSQPRRVVVGLRYSF